MKIRYLGHSSFLISGDNKKIVTDPFDKIGYTVERVTADYCTVSHEHFDHNFTCGVNAKHVIRESANGFLAIDSYHDEDFGAKRGKNRIFKWTIEGITVCHMGDIGEKPNKDLVGKIGEVDVLLIPVGGNYTIDAETAKRYIELIEPRIAVPMHYKDDKSDLDIDGAEKFISLFGKVEYKGKETEISKGSLPRETEVFVMG